MKRGDRNIGEMAEQGARTPVEMTVSRRTAFKIGFFGALGALAAALMFFLIGLLVYAVFLFAAFHRQP